MCEVCLKLTIKMPDFLYVMPLTSTFRIISTISPEMYMLQKSKIDNVLKVKILN